MLLVRRSACKALVKIDMGRQCRLKLVDRLVRALDDTDEDDSSQNAMHVKALGKMS